MSLTTKMHFKNNIQLPLNSRMKRKRNLILTSMNENPFQGNIYISNLEIVSMKLCCFFFILISFILFDDFVDITNFIVLNMKSLRHIIS